MVAALADQAVARLVELVEVGLDVPHGNHALDLGRLDLHVHAPLGDTGHVAVVLLADLVHHELDQLVLRGSALGVRGHELALGGVAARLLVLILLGALAVVQIAGQQAVDHQVRVAADRGGEMCIELERQAVVADVVGAVAGLGHRPQGEVLHGGELRLALRAVQQLVESLRGRADVAVLVGRNLVAEALGESIEVLELDLIRLAVDTVDEGLGVLLRHAVHLPAGGHELRDRAVRQQHELLDQPVGLLRNLLVHADRLALLVHLDLHLRPVEIDRPRLPLVLLHNRSKFVEGGDGLDECRFAGGIFFFYDGLRLVVVEPVVGVNDGAADPAGADFGLRRHLEDGRER